MTLDRVLPSLIRGAAPRIPQNHKAGAYFGARTAEDGVIDWSRDAATIHNLVRAVAPPYPGALTTVGGAAARILRSRVVDDPVARVPMPAIVAHGDRLLAHCGGGGVLQVLSLEIDGTPVTAAGFAQQFGTEPIPLGGSLP
jgi:methionyl-tRNA formyltransferase